MDDIEELKEEVAQLRAITEDTNHTVHKMRRGIWWGRVITLLFWILMLAAPFLAYYYYFQYYLQPYVAQIEKSYAGLQQNTAQVQSFEQQLRDAYVKYFGAQASTSAPQVPQNGTTQ